MSVTIKDDHIIVVGDTTTHGGKVITGISDNFTYKGIPIACVGDLVECPQCGGIYPIVEGAPTVFYGDKQVARHGDKVACGATLISRENAAVSAGSGAGGVASPALSAENSQQIGNRFFIVVDENDKPIPGADYVITDADGTEYPGVTDANGHTATISGKIGEDLSVRVIIDPDYKTA